MRAKKLLSAVAAVAVAGLLTGATAGMASAEAPRHGLGYRLDAKAPEAASDPAQPVVALGAAASVPASVDLTKYALKPGDQGQVGSCVTWATGYTGYGVLMSEQGIKGAPMAPMFIYAQIAKGNDQGTWASVALPMEQKQGIDTKADYWQGDFDYTTQPDAKERANAAHYKLSGFTKLHTGAALKADVQNALAQGMPVPIGIAVHQSFMRLDASQAASYNYRPGPTSSDPVVGGHEITILGYTDKGVTIENSWGSNWGNKGYINLPWDVVTGKDVDEAHAMGKLVKQ